MRIAIPTRIAAALWLIAAMCAPAFAGGGISVDNQAQATYTPSGALAPALASSNTVHVQTASLPPSALSVTKSTTATNPRQGDVMDFTLSIANNGSVDALGTAITIDGAAATKVVTRDVIPANTTFNSMTSVGSGLALYHAWGAPALTYTTNPPTDLKTVDEVAFALDTLPVGAHQNFTFTVRIHNDAIGQISNMGELLYRDGVQAYSANTNLVLAPLPPFTPKIIFYTDAQYAVTTNVAHAGSPLFIQADASGCNIDPLVAETHTITLTSLRTGDRETFTANETGPNTGVFRITPPVPTQDAATHKVVIGDGIMQVLGDDSLTATLNGCGASATTAVVLIDPAGIVFDSTTNQPVAGAVVALIDVTGQGNGGKPNQFAVVLNFDGTPASSTVTTGADGKFQFPLVGASTYKLQVSPPAGYKFPSLFPPSKFPDRRIDPQGSYGNNFFVTVATGAVLLDVPVDSGPIGGLFVQKTSSRAVAEIGDSIDYEVDVKNNTGATLHDVVVNDKLPTGFKYQNNSTDVNGARVADPAGAPGPNLAFHIGDLADNASAKLLYRVKIGVGSTLGDATNAAYAISGKAQSNTARAVVRLDGGVLTDRGYIVGKVYADCDGNRRQNDAEPGVPGVRIYLEDGTYAITDALGRYSFYNVSPRTHILKVDRYSQPAGSQLEPLAARNSGEADSRFVDMQSGSMERADFAFSTCDAKLNTEIALRAKRAKGAGEELELAKNQSQNFAVAEKSQEELRSLAASGVVGPNGQPAQSNSVAASHTLAAAAVATPPIAASPAAPAAPAVDPYAALDNTFEVLSPSEGEILPLAITNLVVKGMAGTTFKLELNGAPVPPTRVGKRSAYEEKQMQVWEFVGITLRPGRNEFKVTQVDSFGIARGTQTRTLLAPNKLGKLQVILPKDMAPADGITPVKVTVRLTDRGELPVTVRTPITLEASAGHFSAQDLDLKEPGTQVFITGGEGVFDLIPPIEPAQALIRVSSGNLKTETKLDFVPELRPLIGAGVAEFKLDLSHGSKPASSFRDLSSGVEQELRSFSADLGSSQSFASRVAMTMKGKVYDNYLLTLGYDSDKNQKDQMFRDAQPEKFYPVYGDGSVRGYDAQSTGKAYLRVDNGRNFAMFGDYTTAGSSYSQSLGTYMRSLNGFKTHYEDKRISVNAFSARDSLKQTVIELPGNGTSGPYSVGTLLAAENSETVQVLVRDRDQPALVVSTKSLVRFVDYTFDAVSGQLLFKSPVPTLDQQLNPVFIRISLEVDQGGEKFWVGGGDGQYKINDRLQFGANFVKDSNPTSAYGLYGFNSGFRIDAHTLATAEVVETQHQAFGNGLGYRFEVKREGGERLNGRFYYGHTDRFFDNPNASLSKGRGEFGLRGDYRLTDRMKLVSEVLSTTDVTTSGNRLGGEIRMERNFGSGMTMQFGFRHAQEGNTPAQPNTVGATPNESSSIITRLTTAVPHLSKASVTGEYEQDVTNADRQMAAIGGTYQVLPSSKVYLRHEFISSLGSVYALNSTQQRSATVIGVDSSYLKNTRVFSEYRQGSVLDNKESEAAIGLNNTWNLARGVAISTGLENVSTVNGKGNSSVALTGGIDWTRSLSWRASGRAEWRSSVSSNSFLSTVGIARSINESFTVLARNLFHEDYSKTGLRGVHPQDRIQFGGAYRGAGASRWNALSMLEIRFESDTTDPTRKADRLSTVFSTNANFKATDNVDFSGRYAIKLVDETARSINSTSGTQLVSGRATYDFARNWDIGASLQTMFQPSENASVFSAGAEMGRMLMKNMWLSMGYNFTGFSAADLAGEDSTRRGAYLRLRLKFDENVLGILRPNR